MKNTFEERMRDILKDDYDNFIACLSQPPYKSLYLNALKKDAKQILDERYIQPHPLVPEGYYYDEHLYHPGSLPYFPAGLYYIQEPSAMLVASLLDIKPDDRVLDLCGAPGGKSCYAASRLGPQGLLVTNDINASRAKILSENIERFAATNVIVTNAKPDRFLKDFQHYFDKIILDAPCSGEGMFRTKEQAISTWSVEKVAHCAAMQRELVDIACRLLKPGGQLIYSTCTYEIEENEDIVSYALSHHPMTLQPLPGHEGLSRGINMPEAIRCYPHRFHGEGQFMALMTKKQSGDAARVSLQKPVITAAERQIVTAFYQENLKILPPRILQATNHHIYAIKPHFPAMNGIRVLRNGLYLGEVRKNRFIPSHSLALTLAEEDVMRTYNFSYDSEEIKRYLHGETLPGSKAKGYGVIYVDHFPLSFYKESDMIKNLYPKGLRR